MRDTASLNTANVRPKRSQDESISDRSEGGPRPNPQTDRRTGLDDDVLVVELLVRGQLELGWIDEVLVDDYLSLGLALADQQVSLAVLPVEESCGGKERESENSLKTSNCTRRKDSNQHGAVRLTIFKDFEG